MDADGEAHRKAAVERFRLKRKERSFHKKVRYESRKRLAESRPRVKGQFVKSGGPAAAKSAEGDERSQATEASKGSDMTKADRATSVGS
jgi:CCT motif